jgi:hypothetical protein
MAKRKKQKDKQRSTKHTYKTKDRVTRTPLKTGGETLIVGLSTNGRSDCHKQRGDNTRGRPSDIIAKGKYRFIMVCVEKG